jgi:hypothetical protein
LFVPDDSSRVENLWQKLPCIRFLSRTIVKFVMFRFCIIRILSSFVLWVLYSVLPWPILNCIVDFWAVQDSGFNPESRIQSKLPRHPTVKATVNQMKLPHDFYGAMISKCTLLSDEGDVITTFFIISMYAAFPCVQHGGLSNSIVKVHLVHCFRALQSPNKH